MVFRRSGYFWTKFSGFEHVANFFPARNDSGHAPGVTGEYGRIAERLLPIFVLGVAVVSVPLLVLAPVGLPRVAMLEREKTAVDEEVSVLSQEIRQLAAEVRRLRDDPSAIERVARDQLGLLRATEVVYHFEP
jgi:cell division protein FtsB